MFQFSKFVYFMCFSVRKQLKSDDGDNDLCTTNIKASLMCPVSLCICNIG